MTTSDQPETSPLTRRRIREIRATGAHPIIRPSVEEEPADADIETPTPEPTAPAPTPLPRAAEPAAVSPAPAPDASVDLGMVALTRRQARAQERIRTASVPVIHADAVPSASATAVPSATEVPVAADVEELLASPSQDRDDVPVTPENSAEHSADVELLEAELQDAEPQDAETHDAEPREAEPVEDAPQDSQAGPLEGLVAPAADRAPVAPPLVHPELGSDLLAGPVPAVSIPPSFDQLIARGSSGTGSVATPNALILSQTPTAAPMSPISSTGEVLITGSFDLPAGLGSVGHAHGTTDGKDLDAALIDGELPPASSPTPIAASAAISTARHSGEEIIRPPAPEKGNKLMLALVITAGVLALALVGVLIFAVTTGVF